MFLRLLKQRLGFVGMSFLVTAVISILFVQTLNAQEDSRKEMELLPVDISMTKKVDHASARPGDTLQYTIDINNSGDVIAPNAVFTDSLPAELTYVSDTLSVTGGGDFGVNNNVISWTGHLNPNGGTVSLVFDAALADDLVAGQTVTNTASLEGPEGVLNASVAISILGESTYTVFMPIIARPLPIVTLYSVSVPTSPDNFVTNKWTVTWSQIDLAGGQYELQEASDSDFTNPTSYFPGVVNTLLIEHPVSNSDEYFYRVRVTGSWGEGSWSNIESQTALYVDKFDSDNGWRIRREDTDDVDNYIDTRDGALYLKIKSRWDYAIASPLNAIPSNWETYEIKTRVRLGDGIDNLHSYGLIFSGDWNGNQCPNSSFSSCFTHYYRLNVIHTGDDSKMRVQLKRIDYHDSDDNAGRGVSLYGYRDVSVNDPDGWNEWSIRVDRGAGTIQVWAGNRLLTTINSQEYINDPYFGVMASDDEYLGTAAFFDYYYVYPMP